MFAGPIFAVILGMLLMTKTPPSSYLNPGEAAIALLLLVWFLSAFGYSKQSKWDIRIVSLDGATDEIKSLLRRTTKKGFQIHVVLLKCFDREDITLSQTDLVERAQRKMRIERVSKNTVSHEELSRSQIVDEYIKALEDQGIIEIVSRGHEVRYRLTQMGRDTRRIAEWYFPSSNALFYARNVLRMRPSWLQE